MAKILLVEDDETIGESLKLQLQKRGNEVEWVDDGLEGLSRLRFYQYDMAIIDWRLPGLTGPEIVRQYRNHGGLSPVMMLTSFNETSQKIEGLDSGADDYVTKPFEIDEVCARIQALLRRPANIFPAALRVGSIEIDIGKKLVSRDGIPIKLLPKEFALLEFLLRHADQFFEVNALLDHVWGSESDATDAAVWQVVKRLRNKLDDPDGESIIVNVKGMGYKVDKSRIQSG
jgi:two-component system OmpR family response regulator